MNKKKNKSKISTEDLKKIDLSVERESMKEQGFFDGRFRTRIVESKKIYSRSKNKKIDF